MNALRLFMVTTIVASFALVTPASADWYVVQNQVGSRNVADYVPGYGWSIISGPYATVDAAKREMGTGDLFASNPMSVTIQPAVPRGTGRYNPENIGYEPLEFAEVPEVQMPARRVYRQARASKPAAVSQDFGVAAGAGMEKPSGEVAEFELFELKGESARDRAGKDLGRIDYLVIARDGRISHVIFSRQAKFVPVPWEACTFWLTTRSSDH